MGSTDPLFSRTPWRRLHKQNASTTHSSSHLSPLPLAGAECELTPGHLEIRSTMQVKDHRRYLHRGGTSGTRIDETGCEAPHSGQNAS